MSKLLRGLVAGYGAKKLGGCGCTGILLFILLWWLLGLSGIKLLESSPSDGTGHHSSRVRSWTEPMSRRRAVRLFLSDGRVSVT